MKILVTGGSGYIGKAFIRAYRKTFDIVAPTNEQADLTDARATDKLFVDNKFDAVLHLAGAELDPGVSFEANDLIMFKNVQYLAIAHGVKKLIVVGGGDYDGTKPVVDFTEEMFAKNRPSDGRCMGRYLISQLAGKDKITTVLRVFDVFGTDGGAQRPINKIVLAASRGKKQIVIDRDRVVSAVSLDDVLRVTAEFLKRDLPRGDYNLVAGDKMSYSEIAKTVKKLLRKDGGDIDIVIKNPDPAPECTAVNDKLLGVLPLRLVSMQNGVKNLYLDSKK